MSVSYTHHQNLNMTLKGGTKQACAACRFRRKRCTPECVFAPYFPADQPKTFRNVHRLFGVGNVEKILRNLHPSEHKIAMESIISEAYYRDIDPVHGCWGEICRLQYEVWCVEQELSALHQRQREICRQQYSLQHYLGSSSSMVNDVTTLQSELGVMTTPLNNHAFPLFNHNNHPIVNDVTTLQSEFGMMMTPRNNHEFPLFNQNNRPIIIPETYNSEVSLPAVSDQQSYCNGNSTVGYNNSMDVQSRDHVVVAPNSLGAHQQNPCPDDGRDSMAMAMHSQSQLVSSQTGHGTKSYRRILQ